MDTRQDRQDAAEDTPSDDVLAKLKKEIEEISSRIKRLGETVSHESKAPHGVIREIISTARKEASRWVFWGIAGLLFALYPNLWARIKQGAVALVGHPMTSEAIKLAMRLLWKQQKIRLLWFSVMILTSVVCYVCLLGAAFVVLANTLGLLNTWLILAAFNLAVSLLGGFFVSRASK